MITYRFKEEDGKFVCHLHGIVAEDKDDAVIKTYIKEFTLGEWEPDMMWLDSQLKEDHVATIHKLCNYLWEINVEILFYEKEEE